MEIDIAIIAMKVVVYSNLLPRGRLTAPYPGKKALTILELVVREKEPSGTYRYHLTVPS